MSMNKKNQKILTKANECLHKYSTDDSVYYKELKKSVKEYKELELTDKITNDLYVEHINQLCDFIKKRNRANVLISLMVMFSIFIVLLASYSTYKYYTLSSDIKNNVLNNDNSTSLIVNYKNIEGFDANTLANEEDYSTLTPLTLSILAKSENEKSRKFHYDVYIIEDNDDIIPTDLLSKNTLLYNVKSNSKDSGIKELKNSSIIKDKMLIFSGEVTTNIEEDVDIRMWIDSKTNLDYKNKKYKFKIYVDGYLS